MMAKADIAEYIKNKVSVFNGQQPIFEIMMLENTGDKELVYPTGKPSGFPDTGITDTVGFYYELDKAIEALHCNTCDLRETVYDAAFILCRFPGLYNCVPSEGRMYFVWDKEKEGYFEAEEPELFKRVAY
jgi:hypothetical protein